MRAVLIGLTALLSTNVSPSCCAQVPQGAKPAQQLSSGATNPELIPELEAWKTMLQFASDCAGCGSREFREGFLQGSGLSHDDLDLVFQAGNAYRLVMQDVIRRYQKAKGAAQRPPSKDEWAQMTASFKELDPAVEKQKKFLQDELSPSAYQKLADFVSTRVKATMVAPGK